VIRALAAFIYMHIIEDRRAEQINTSGRANENHKKPMARHVMDHECLRDACPVATTSVREIKCLIFNFRLNLLRGCNHCVTHVTE